MSHANVTTRAAELAALLLEEVSEADQNWHTIEWCARELTELAAQVLQGSIDAIAEVARRVNEGPIQIEDEQLEGFDRYFPQHPDHTLQCKRRLTGRL